MEILKLLDECENFALFKEEVLTAIKTHSRKGEDNSQFMLQTLEEGQEDWHTGVGRVEQLEVKMENDYVHIQPSLKGTMIEKMLLKYNGYRARIMVMHPRNVYTVHADSTARIHIPVVTNMNCWMVWPFNQRCYQLKAGYVYQTDTTKRHTFFNGDMTQTRIHIVMCI
jgi:hypothetical protein